MLQYNYTTMALKGFKSSEISTISFTQKIKKPSPFLAKALLDNLLVKG
jgi:type VI protein secretion system component Hcp